MLDINDPKVRWAQQLADKTNEQQCIIRNAIGGLDIKRASAINLVNNQKVLAIIEPKNQRLTGENHAYKKIRSFISLRFSGRNSYKPYTQMCSYGNGAVI